MGESGHGDELGRPREVLLRLGERAIPSHDPLALKRRVKEEFRDVAVITEAERDALLTAAGDSCQPRASARRPALI